MKVINQMPIMYIQKYISRSQSAAVYLWRTMTIKKVFIFSFCWNPDTWKMCADKKGADNIDISRHSLSYFFNTTCFTPPGKVFSSSSFLVDYFSKKNQFSSLRPNPHKLKMQKSAIAIVIFSIFELIIF